MARRKSDAEVGTLGVWAYNTRDALDLSVEAAVAMLPTAYHPATLRKVEGGSARPGTRMWRELGALYARVAQEKGVDIEPQPRLRPEPAETTQTPDTLIAALMAQTEAINALVARLDSLAGEAIREGVADANDVGADDKHLDGGASVLATEPTGPELRAREGYSHFADWQRRQVDRCPGHVGPPTTTAAPVC